MCAISALQTTITLLISMIDKELLEFKQTILILHTFEVYTDEHLNVRHTRHILIKFALLRLYK
jgi:hypothetical protein